MRIFLRICYSLLFCLSFQSWGQGVGIAEVDHSCTFEEYTHGKAFVVCGEQRYKIVPYDLSLNFCQNHLTKPFADFFSALTRHSLLRLTTVSICGGTMPGQCEFTTRVNTVESEHGLYSNNATFVRPQDDQVLSCGIGYQLISR